MTSTDLALNLIQRVNIGDSLTRSAARDPGALALVEGERRLSYAEFNGSVNRVAHALVQRGLHAGDAVALAAGNCIEFLVTYYACAKIGAVCVPINLGWNSDEVLVHVLRHSGARVLVLQAGLASTLAGPAAAANLEWVVVIDGGSTGGQAAVPPIGDLPTVRFAELMSFTDASEPECLVPDRAPLAYWYTSGTSKLPIGVVGNHLAAYLQSMAMVIEGRFRDDDRFAAMMPLFHTAQLNCQCTPAIMVGATIHLLPHFDPDVLLTLIEHEGITQIFALPAMFQAMLEHPTIAARKLSTLRRALYAMGAIPPDTLARCVKVFGCEFYLVFGQTELNPAASVFRPENQFTHPGAVGTPVVNVAVAIMGDDGSLLAQGQTGEIVYRGPQMMTAYRDDPEATSRAFGNGWFHSGDLGRFDTDGILWFSGRSKDVIKTGGENVSSLEVEKAVYASEPGAAQVAVIGLPHPHWTEAITAFVVPRPGSTLDPETIRRNLRGHLDPYKIPKAVIVVDELARTATGELQKDAIRQRYSDYYQST